MRQLDMPEVRTEPFAELIKIKDLVYYDGPLMTLWRKPGESDEFVISFWVDVDDTYHRWVYVSIEWNLLMQVWTNTKTLRNMVTNNPDGYVHIVDIDTDIKFCHAYQIPVSDLPEDYNFTKDAYYDASLA